MKTWALLGAMLVGSSLFAGEAHQDEHVVVYHGEDECGPLGNDLEILKDPTGHLTIKDVLHRDDFVRATTPVPNLGVSSSVYWARAQVVNASSQKAMTLLVDHAEIDELDLYLATEDGKVIPLAHDGQLRPKDPNRNHVPGYSYPLPIPYGGYGEVYLRVKSDKQLQVPLYILNKESNATVFMDRNFFVGGYVGIMVVMLLYNFLLFISIRDNNYLYYSIYLLSVGLTQLTFLGYANYFFWPGIDIINAHASTTLTVLTMVTAVEFMQRFINIKQHIRGFVKVKRIIYFFAIGAVVACFFGFSIEGYQTIQLTSAVMASYMLYVAIVMTRKGHRPAVYFLSAWSVFMTGIVIFVAKDWGLLPYNDITKHMMTIGSAVEVVLLSFGLADKINTLRHEKEQLILEQNVVLESKVAERTHALEESNRHLKNTQTKLVSAEKMASLGQLTAGIAHEINNPLNFISSNIPPLKRNLLDLKEVLDSYREASKDDPRMAEVHALEKRIDLDFTVQEVKEIMDCIESGASRTSEIVRGLRTFSRLDEDDLKMADVNEGLRSTVVVLGPQFRDAVEIEYELGDIPQVECYPGKLNQVFMNLLNNAAHAVKQRHGRNGGRIKISTSEAGGRVLIAIADNGIGMDESVQQRLFEPFFTTKEVGEGTGLGLSICQGIVEKHNGTLDLISAPGVGSTFTINIPVHQAGQYAKSA